VSSRDFPLPVQTGSPAFEDVSGACTQDELFALQVLGDSMEPEFQNGHVIVVDPAGVLNPGSFVVAQHQGEYIFRQYRVDGGRRLLAALNPAYPELVMGEADSISGVVVKRAARRRRDCKYYV
jgi:SOS-response transcriptional repressor LexA